MSRNPNTTLAGRTTDGRRVYKVAVADSTRCATCGRLLAAGEAFTRRRPSGVAGTRPICGTCRPFDEDGPAPRRRKYTAWRHLPRRYPE